MRGNKHRKAGNAQEQSHGGGHHQQATGANRLTTNQGVDVADNQNSLRAGERGPTLMEDFIFRTGAFRRHSPRIEIVAPRVGGVTTRAGARLPADHALSVDQVTVGLEEDGGLTKYMRAARKHRVWDHEPAVRTPG